MSLAHPVGAIAVLSILAVALCLLIVWWPFRDLPDASPLRESEASGRDGVAGCDRGITTGTPPFDQDAA